MYVFVVIYMCVCVFVTGASNICVRVCLFVCYRCEGCEGWGTSVQDWGWRWSGFIRTGNTNKKGLGHTMHKTLHKT